MSVNQVTGPFEREVQTVVETTENYTIDNTVDTVDLIGQVSRTIKLPPHPVAGQKHRILAALAAVTVDGNGHSIADGLTNIPAGVGVDFTFSSQSNVWISSCEGTHV